MEDLHGFVMSLLDPLNEVETCLMWLIGLLNEVEVEFELEDNIDKLLCMRFLKWALLARVCYNFHKCKLWEYTYMFDPVDWSLEVEVRLK